MSTDTTKVELWLKEQPNPLESFTQFDFDYIKNQLHGYLNPGEEVNQAPAEASEPSTFVHEAPVIPGTGIMEEQSTFTLEAATEGKKTNASKFNDLFNE